MRKVAGRENMKAAPAIAVTISSAAAMSRSGELCLRLRIARLTLELSDTDMLQPV